jgi:peptidoglycan/LPS O-acetylase OafA/YrhL
MLIVHRKDIGQPRSVGSFVWKRFRRIYPFFWVILAVTMGLVWRFPSIGQPFYRDPAVLLQSFALAGEDPLHAVVFVSWTLWHEVIFYAICASVIVWPKAGIPIFVIWTAACAVLEFVDIPVFWPGYMTGFINILFAFGVVVGLLLTRYRLPKPSLILFAGVVLFLGTGVWVDLAPVPEWLTHVLFGLGGALALAGGVEVERSGGWTAPAWLVLLGGASFSIYLSHILTLSFLAKGAQRLGLTTSLPAPIAFVILAGSAIAVGIGVHVLVEKPILRLATTLKEAITARWRPAQANPHNL